MLANAIRTVSPISKSGTRNCNIIPIEPLKGSILITVSPTLVTVIVLGSLIVAIYLTVTNNVNMVKYPLLLVLLEL